MCNTEHTEKQKKSLYFHTGQIVFLNFTYFPVQKKGFTVHGKNIFTDCYESRFLLHLFQIRL